MGWWGVCRCAGRKASFPEVVVVCLGREAAVGFSQLLSLDVSRNYLVDIAYLPPNLRFLRARALELPALFRRSESPPCAAQSPRVPRVPRGLQQQAHSSKLQAAGLALLPGPRLQPVAELQDMASEFFQFKASGDKSG